MADLINLYVDFKIIMSIYCKQYFQIHFDENKISQLDWEISKYRPWRLKNIPIDSLDTPLPEAMVIHFTDIYVPLSLKVFY